jgi:Fe-S cluster biogenesis protein NfuA
MEEAIRRVLDEQIRPGVQGDGGDIELVDVVDGVVRVRMVGACVG